MKYELGNLMAENPESEALQLLAFRLNSLTAERDSLLDQLSNGDTMAIHSCHQDCQRVLCVLRRERDELKARLEELVFHPEEEPKWKDDIINNIL